MNDMTSAIIPKSDQLNSDDLIAGPITITITDVTIRGGQEQPVSIHFEGDNGKPYKTCKSMNRVLVTAWGADASKYVGRSMTLYRDPSVKWAGMEVGGIRISHLSDIDSKITMALTATKGSRKPYTVQPLKADAQKAAPAHTPPDVSSPADSAPDAAPDDALLIKAREFAECGTERYAEWFKNVLTKEQRAHIGTARHDELKLIAAKVTV